MRLIRESSAGGDSLADGRNASLAKLLKYYSSCVSPSPENKVGLCKKPYYFFDADTKRK